MLRTDYLRGPLFVRSPPGLGVRGALVSALHWPLFLTELSFKCKQNILIKYRKSKIDSQKGNQIFQAKGKNVQLNIIPYGDKVVGFSYILPCRRQFD